MSTHVPLSRSDASQRFHWNLYVIGNAPFHEPTPAVRKRPTTGCASPPVSVIVGYPMLTGAPFVESIDSQSGAASAVDVSAVGVPPVAATTARWPAALMSAIFEPSGENAGCVPAATAVPAPLVEVEEIV